MLPPGPLFFNTIQQEITIGKTLQGEEMAGPGGNSFIDHCCACPVSGLMALLAGSHPCTIACISANLNYNYCHV